MSTRDKKRHHTKATRGQRTRRERAGSELYKPARAEADNAEDETPRK